MRRVICDIECTVSNKGNCFDQTNKLVVVGIRDVDTKEVFLFYYPTKEDLIQIQSILSGSLFIAHNAKFDLHWIRKIGIDISTIRVWCTQIGEFLLNNQLTPYPSLDGAAMKYGYPKKLDIVKTEYWEKGIDTDMIPREILSDYLAQDLKLTEQVYLEQVKQMRSSGKLNLFKLQCADLLVLEEMEWNGINFNTKKARVKAEELQTEIDEITVQLASYTDGIPFNPNSNDHVSALLYGGNITVDDRIPVGFFKTGAKVGHTRYKIIQKVYELPRLVEPLKGTETAKEGFWKTNADVLRSLKLDKRAKAIVGLLNRYSELEKLRGTYLIGWSDLIDKMNWPKDKIHGTLNQCVAVTGRLSSTKPNLQNANPTTKIYCESVYEHI